MILAVITAISVALALAGVSASVYFYIKDKQAKAVLIKREQDVSRRMYELAILKELGDRIGYSLDVQQIIDIIINSLHQFIDYSAVSYMLLGPEKVIFKMHLERSVHQRFVNDIKDRMLGSLGALLDREFNKKDVKDIISGAIIIEELDDPVRSFFNIPLVIDEKVVGVLTVADTKEGLYKEEEMTILYKIIQQASKAVTSLQGVVKAEQAKVNAMVESMADGVVMTDTDYRIMVVNPSARAIIGQPAEKDITIFDFIDNLEGKFDIRGKLEESVKLNKPFKSEEVFIRDNFYKIFVFPVSAATGEGEEKSVVGGVVIFHDVTAERSIEQIREQFTSMIVHELRTPLSGINKISELLRAGPKAVGKKEYEQYLGMIHTDSTGMLELVNDILDISKLEAGKFDVKKEPTDIKTVIDNRIEFFLPSAKDAKLTLGVAYDAELPPLVPVDAQAIKQVLNNLISNSIKFTKADGSVEVVAVHHAAGGKISEELARVKKAKLSVAIPDAALAEAPESVVIAVTDTGAGVSESGIKELFTKFKQLGTKSETGLKGTGLGLAIAKGVVEEHGGTIGVVSEVGVGSVFYFVIPLQ